MSETLRNQLDTELLHGKSINEWHTWLITDPVTGENQGHLRCPASRYGHRSEDVAWYAVAAECIFTYYNGPSDSPEESINYMMSLAVNDHADIAALISGNWHSIPQGLQQILGTKRQVKELLQ